MSQVTVLIPSMVGAAVGDEVGDEVVGDDVGELVVGVAIGDAVVGPVGDAVVGDLVKEAQIAATCSCPVELHGSMISCFPLAPSRV